MLVSIIINNNNYARFLRTAIDSALAQDYPAVEVLVVDDGSDDESRAIIEEYGDQVVSIFKENGGQATCFNLGFQRSSGEVVFFLDADDLLYPNAAARAAEILKDRGYSKCQGYLDIIDGDGARLSGSIPDWLSPTGDYRTQLLDSGPEAHCAAYTSGNAWSRHFLQRIMPIPTDNRQIGADAYLVTIDGLFGRIATLDAPIGAYRRHGTNHSMARRVFIPKFVDQVAQNYAERSCYLADWANRLGNEVDPDLWTCRSWRSNLIFYSRWLLGSTSDRPSFRQLVLDPEKPQCSWKRAFLTLALAAVWLSPKPMAGAIARRLVGFRTPSRQGTDSAQSDEASVNFSRAA